MSIAKIKYTVYIVVNTNTKDIILINEKNISDYNGILLLIYGADMIWDFTQ